MPDIQLNGQSITTGSTSGTTAPATGATETWTVTALAAGIPTLDTSRGQTYALVDATAAAVVPQTGTTQAQTAEVIRVNTAVAGATSITVTRGADGTTPVAHATGSTFNIVVVAGSIPRSKLPYYAPSGLLNDFDPTTSTYNSNSRTMRKTRVACGRVASAAGSMHMVATGDSAGIGYNGTSYVSGNAFPRQCGMALAEMLGVRYAQGIVPANAGGALSDQWIQSTLNANYATNSPQLITMTQAGYLEFQPDTPGDSVQIFVSNLSGGATYQIDGGTPVTITTTGANTIQLITVTGLTDDLHKVRINWVSGTFYVVGCRLYPSGPALHFHNLCVGGTYANLATAPSSAAKNWSSTTTPGLGYTHPGMVTAAGFTVDIHVIVVGNNDHNQTSSPATITTGLTNMRGFWPSAEVVYVHPWMVSGANATTFDTLCGAIYTWVDGADVGHVDWNDIVGGQATALANGALGADSNHPIDGTSIFMGRILARVIGSSLEATVPAYETHDFSVTGAVTVATGVHRVYNIAGRPLKIKSVRASVGTAPTGAALVVDVKKSGTTIFTGGTGRPTIAVSTNTAAAGTPAITAWEADSYLTVDVTQVGSTIAGSDLTVQITAA